RVDAEMEDRRRQDGVGRSIDQPLPEMLERARAAGGDDGNGHGGGNGPRQLEIVPVLGAVAVHAGQEDLAGSQPRRLACPFHRVASTRPATTVGKHFPRCNGSRQPGLLRGWPVRGAEWSRWPVRGAEWFRWPVRGAEWLRSRGTTVLGSPSVDGHHDALTAE